MCLGCYASSTSLELCQLAPQLWGGALAGRTEVWVPETQLGYLRVLGPSPERVHNQNAFHPVLCAGESISVNSSWDPLPPPQHPHAANQRGFILSFTRKPLPQEQQIILFEFPSNAPLSKSRKNTTRTLCEQAMKAAFASPGLKKISTA